MKIKRIAISSLAFALAFTFLLAGNAYAWTSGSGTTTMPLLLNRADSHTLKAGLTWNDWMYPFNDARVLDKPAVNKLPAMGWNSWNCYESSITEAKIRSIADSFIRLGLDECGYQYVIIDDGCYASRSGGLLRAHTTNFPNGFKTLSTYINELGLKFGMYNNAATSTCGGQSGSWGYEDVDAQTFLDWGVEYLKYDFCSNPWSAAAYRHTPYMRSITVDGVKYNAVDALVTGSARKVTASSPGVVSGTGGNYVDTIGTHDGTYQWEPSTWIAPYGDLIYTVEVDEAGTYDVGIEMRIAAAVGMPSSDFGLANPGGGRTHYNGLNMQVEVNGLRTINRQFTTSEYTAGTGTFETRVFPMELKAGTNEIRICSYRLWENNLLSMAAMYDGLQKAYSAAGKEVPIFSLCEWGCGSPWLGWGRKVGDSWRIASDITNRVHRGQFNTSYDGSIPGKPTVRPRSSVVYEYNANVILDEYAGLDKGWNDPDMMMVGLNDDNNPKPGYTYAGAANNEAAANNFYQFNFNQDKSHFSAWCMMNSPLLLGNNLNNVQVGDDVHKVITNKEVIALNQDPLGIQAKRILNTKNPDPSMYDVTRDRIDVLAKPLADGDIALMFFNVSPVSSETASVDLDLVEEKIGHKMAAGSKFFEAEAYSVKDLWTKEVSFMSRNDIIEYTVGLEDSVTIRITPIDDKVFDATLAKESDGKITASFILADPEAEKIEASLILALYDDLGRMIDTKIEKVEVNSQFYANSITSNIPLGSKWTAKAFIWDKDFVPQTSPAELKDPGADKTGLEALINQADALDSAQYTVSSFAVVTTALTTAKSVYGESNPSQTTVDSAAAALSSAINGLVVAPRLSLGNLITTASALDPSNYEPESADALAAGILAAQAVYNNASAGDAAYVAATAALQSVIDGLKLAFSFNYSTHLKIQNVYRSTRYIEGYSGTTSVGGNIGLWTLQTSAYDDWRVTPGTGANAGYFQIYRCSSVTAVSTSCLYPMNGALADHTRITLAAGSSTSDAVWWKLERQPNGSYIISSKAAPDMVLAINHDVNANGPTSASTIDTTSGYIVIAARGTMQSQTWNFYQSNSGTRGIQVYPAS
ncbi:MAG: alpha-galactosidase [Oscillospiraceae bacterium]|nr:alpha-galactosidase [Oscillospiraceae bacterium]